MRTLFLLTSIILAPTILTSCEDGSDGKIFGDDSDGNDLLDRPEPDITPNPGTVQDCPDGSVDFDGDGFCTATDCNDEDYSIYPGAPEQCDDLDHDCSGISGISPFKFEASGSYTVAQYYVDTDCDATLPPYMSYVCATASEYSALQDTLVTRDRCLADILLDVTRGVSTCSSELYLSLVAGEDCFDNILEAPNAATPPEDVYPCNGDDSKNCGVDAHEDCLTDGETCYWGEIIDYWLLKNECSECE